MNSICTAQGSASKFVDCCLCIESEVQMFGATLLLGQFTKQLEQMQKQTSCSNVAQDGAGTTTTRFLMVWCRLLVQAQGVVSTVQLAHQIRPQENCWRFPVPLVPLVPTPTTPLAGASFGNRVNKSRKLETSARRLRPPNLGGYQFVLSQTFP